MHHAYILYLRLTQTKVFANSIEGSRVAGDEEERNKANGNQITKNVEFLYLYYFAALLCICRLSLCYLTTRNNFPTIKWSSFINRYLRLKIDFTSIISYFCVKNKDLFIIFNCLADCMQCQSWLYYFYYCYSYLMIILPWRFLKSGKTRYTETQGRMVKMPKRPSDVKQCCCRCDGTDGART